jgi:branched-chain amino acid transport system permease protein
VAAVLYVAAQVLGPLSYITSLITISLIYLVAVLGLNVPSGMLGQLSLGHGAVFAIGAYVAAIGTTTYGWPLMYTLPLATAAGLVVGAVLGMPASRLNVLGLGMISLGLTLVVTDLATAVQFTGGPSGLVVPAATLFPSGANLGPNDLYIVVLVLAVVAYIFHWYLRTSHLGRIFLAIKSQEVGTLALGINPYWYKVVGLAIGSALGALAGALYAYVQQVVAPDAFGVSLSILFLLMVILGGAGTRVGPVFGTAIISVVPIFLNQYPSVNVYIYGALLILLARLRPRGLYSRSSAPVSRRLPRPGRVDLAPVIENTPALPVIRVESVSKAFGGNKALEEVTLPVLRSEVLAIVGPNGSGKTTLLNVVSGYVTPDTGRVEIDGRLAGRTQPYTVARLGIGRTFQVPKVFANLSVDEHLDLARRHGRPDGHMEALGLQFLTDVGLSRSVYSKEVRTLGHGHLRFLEIAMAILRAPDVLLLDEPAAGLSLTEIDHLIELLKQLATEGVAVVVVGHHLDIVRRAARRVAVMHVGKLLWEGVPAELENSELVRDAYLGVR